MKKHQDKIKLDLVNDYEKFVGTLESYYETGMECLGLILYKEGETFRTKNLSFTEDGKNGPAFYKTHEGIIFIKKGDIILIGGKKTIGIGNHTASHMDSYKLSEYPYLDGRRWSDDEKINWLKLFNQNIKAELYRPKSKDGESVFICLDPDFQETMKRIINRPMF